MQQKSALRQPGMMLSAALKLIEASAAKPHQQRLVRVRHLHMESVAMGAVIGQFAALVAPLQIEGLGRDDFRQ
jgi:hypothetical protein